MYFPVKKASRLGAAALLLLPPFVLLLVSLVVPPTEDTHWRKIDVSGSFRTMEIKGYYTSNLFDFKAVIGDDIEDIEASLLGDDDNDFCSDATKETLGDACCEHFQTSQALAITATALSGVAWLFFSSAILMRQATRVAVLITAILSFSAGVIGTTLVMLYDHDLSSPLCGSDSADSDAFKDLEYGPLFYVATVGSILAVLAGVALSFLSVDDSTPPEYGGNAFDLTNARVGGAVAAPAAKKSDGGAASFPGRLVF